MTTTTTRSRAREVVAVYRDARARARQAHTLRLRRQERRAVGLAQAGPLDDLAIARWAAIRDELTTRGEPILRHR